MSWGVSAIGNPPGVYGKVAADSNLPDEIKQCVMQILSRFPQDVAVIVETSGHLWPEGTPPSGPNGSATLTIKILPASTA